MSNTKSFIIRWLVNIEQDSVCSTQHPDYVQYVSSLDPRTSCLFQHYCIVFCISVNKHNAGERQKALRTMFIMSLVIFFRKLSLSFNQWVIFVIAIYLTWGNILGTLQKIFTHGQINPLKNYNKGRYSNPSTFFCLYRCLNNYSLHYISVTTFNTQKC